MKLFESHAHYHLYELSPLTEAKIFQEEFDDLNVDKCCFLSIPQEYDSLGNKKFDLLHNLRGIYLKKYFYPNGYCYAGLVHPDKYDDLVSIQNDFYEQVKRFYMMGYDGVKMLEGYPTFIKYTKQGLNSPIYDKFYDFCEKNHFPITMHIANPDENWDIKTASKEAIAQGRVYDGSYPSKEEITLQMFDVLDKFPNLHLTLAHFGFFSLHYEDAIKFMSYPHTRLDTTPGGEQFINISKQWEKWSSFFEKYQDRIIYGSDLYPFIKNEYWKIAYHRRPDFLKAFFNTDSVHDYLGENFKGVNANRDILDKIFYLNNEKYLKNPRLIDYKLVNEEINRIEAMNLSNQQKDDLLIIKEAFRGGEVMKLNNIWGYGQLFGFSALDGPNRYYEDNTLMTMETPLEWRFEYFPHFIKMAFPNKKVEVECLMNDFIKAKTEDGKFALVFLDNDTLIGYSPSLPIFMGESEISHTNNRGVDIYYLNNHFLGFKYFVRKDGLYEFVIHHSFALTEARSGANYYLGREDVDKLIDKRIKYFKDLPECKDKKYESLYYKALSVNKVNIHSPEGKIDSMWTTPDRVPHRHMWMWDSVFHAMAISTYNTKLAKEILLAMLKQTREDGFMPHMANPTDCSDVTQPCIMSFGVLEVYKVSKDKEFLKACLPYLEKYLTYDIKNRDRNKNGLLEWKTEPDYEECKCGESGLDNSPRFDFDIEMDCIDFSTYLALDTKALSDIYEILGDNKMKQKWLDISNKTASLINKLLWSEEDGVYYDRLFTGELTHVLTPASFFPMLAKISTEEQAKRMVEVLTNKNKLWSNNPIASISQEDPRFSNDMWRGGVWVNLNYFIIKGLKQYGYTALAESLRDKTLDMINKWYLKTGCIFEFFDPKGETVPYDCHRKGDPLPKPDYRKHVHSISDYNWSACFAILLIQNIY